MEIKIRDTIIKNKLIPMDPFIYPMSAIRDEEIFKELMDKHIGNVNIILETGTHAGLSSLFLSHYSNIIHTFDIRDYKEKYNVWECFGVNNGDNKLNIEFHLIKNDEEKKEIVENIGKVDFCFVDGHHKNGCDKDFEILRPYCNKFLFHDYNPEKCTGGDGLYDWMKKFLDSIMKEAKIVDIKSPFVYMEFEDAGILQ